jgi:hypothetical protein
MNVGFLFPPVLPLQEKINDVLPLLLTNGSLVRRSILQTICSPLEESKKRKHHEKKEKKEKKKKKKRKKQIIDEPVPFCLHCCRNKYSKTTCTYCSPDGYHKGVDM